MTENPVWMSDSAMDTAWRSVLKQAVGEDVPDVLRFDESLLIRKKTSIRIANSTSFDCSPVRIPSEETLLNSPGGYCASITKSHTSDNRRLDVLAATRRKAMDHSCRHFCPPRTILI